MSHQDYFGKRHGYMFCADGTFSEYVFAVIKRLTRREFEDVHSLYELGAGMGRFSHALVKRFPREFLIEPSTQYARVLRELFPQKSAVVVEATADEFFGQDRSNDGKAACFCFHVLHHLSPEQRRRIYDMVRQLRIEACFVDPNPFNPLILVQVLFHPAMRYREEKGYLKLTRRRLLAELADAGLARSEHSYLCLLPPGMARLALRLKLGKWLLKLEALRTLVPFLAAYQLVYCQPEGGEAEPSS